MIVVDVNVVAYLLIQGAKTALARAVFTKDPSWTLPPLWQDEFLNVLVMQVRQTGFSIAVASQTWSRALELLLPVEQRVDKLMVLQTACQHQITAYDAQYVVLAGQLDVNLVTEDTELQRKFPRRTVSMQMFCKV